MKGVVTFLALVFLVGCHRAPLTCRSEYLYPSYLASERADTPDPCRLCFYGQQVVIFWNLRGFLWTNSPPELALDVRYGDRTTERYFFPIPKKNGYTLFRIINDAYWEKGGILAYKVTLFQEGSCLAEWRHDLWVDLIEFGNP